jgi:hypothetical protein
MAKEPRILASFLHGTLEVIDSMGSDLGSQVRASLKPEVLEEIENAWAAGWLPLAYDVELTTAFFRLAGAERACEAMRRNMTETFRKPALRTLVDGAVRLFGLSPGKLLGWAPRIWPLLFRDVAELHIEVGPAAATLRLVDLPPEVSEHRDYLRGTASAIAAVFDLTGVAGECRLADHGGGEARFELEWETGSPPGVYGTADREV